jgi:hypothetical protein
MERPLVYVIFIVARLEPRDQMYSYGVEDTPLNFSTATSLSDLTMDEGPGGASGRISVDSHDGLLEHRRHRR